MFCRVYVMINTKIYYNKRVLWITSVEGVEKKRNGSAYNNNNKYIFIYNIICKYDDSFGSLSFVIPSHFFCFCFLYVINPIRHCRWKWTWNLCTGTPRKTPPTTCTCDTCTTWPAGRCKVQCPAERLRHSLSTRTRWELGRRVCTPDGAISCTGTASRTPAE